MNFLKVFETNKATEQKGICLEFGDSKFFGKRAGKSNKAYVVALSNFHKKHKFQIENDILDDNVALPELAGVFFDHISTGWENVRYPENDEVNLEYTKENFIALMVKYPEFFDEYRNQFQIRANFQAEKIEDDSKN